MTKKEEESESIISRLITLEEDFNITRDQINKIDDLEAQLKDSNWKALEQEKTKQLINKKLGVLKERESKYTELQIKFDDLLKKVDDMSKKIVDDKM